MASFYSFVLRLGRTFFALIGVPTPGLARRVHRFISGALAHRNARPPEDAGALTRALQRIDAWDRAAEIPTRSARQLWVAACLPPTRSGVAFFTQRSLCAPTQPVVFFTPVRGRSQLHETRRSIATIRQGLDPSTAPVEVLSLATLSQTRQVYPLQPVVYVLGNSEHHLGTIDALLRDPIRDFDALHLHDVFMGDVLELYFGTEPRLTEALSKVYPSGRVSEWLVSRRTGIEAADPVNGARLFVERGARHFIVNSAAAAERLVADLGSWSDGIRIDKLFLPILQPPISVSPNKTETLRIGHFGVLHSSKQIDRLVGACDLLVRRRSIELSLVGYGVRQYVRRHGLSRQYIRIVDSPSDVELQTLMAAVDGAVQLRYPDHGESSGVVNQLLALRRPVICTRVGSFVELEGAVHLVATDVDAASLAASIEQATSIAWPSLADSIIARRSPRVFESRLRELISLD